MLSRALDKANTAVKLDKAENYTNARDAYVEACELLQQVLSRTNGEDDRKKLDAIRRTYTSRIEELDALVPENSLEEKALPARPDSLDTAGLHYPGVQIEMAGVDNRSDAATFTRSNRDESPNPQISSHAVPPAPSEPNGTIYSDFSRGADAFHPSFSGPLRRNFEGGPLTIPRSDNAFLPAPLSPFRPSSPAAKPPSPEPVVRQDFSLAAERERLAAAAAEHRSHRRNLSHESGSWLDPINESGGSADSSPHSRSSSRNIRKHIRLPSGNTEAEFDAALDAAVEAAYDDSYERPATYDEAADDSMTLSRRKVELAKERVREVEREVVIEAAREHERQRQMSVGQESQTYGGGFFDANDSDEEEERMLDEMARSYGMDDFALSQSSRYHQSSVPRESDSSGLTSRTWHSSMQSNPPTGTTTLSTVSEMAGNNASSPPSMPPPTQSLPQPPVNNRLSSAAGMRSRRSSSQNAKQLKIETSKLGPPPSFPLPKPAGGYIAQQRQQALSSTSTRGPFSSLGPSSPVRGTHSSSDAVAAPMSPLSDHEEEEHEAGSPTSVPPGMGMRKNFSSSSLRSLKTRQLSTASHLDEHDPSPVTPLSRQVSNTSVSRQPMMPALPTPLVSAFAEKMGGHLGGLSLFDSDFHQFDSPRSSYHPHLQQQQSPDIPLPLEPCPSEAMLRPFWLMRALYQTLAHPRGGYLSTRLFVPREAWKVKGVKLRNVEDKVSQCDLVTAALLKLARVDSTDADALLHEMESLEVILDSVQATLVRRLGTEVGSQGVGSIKDDGTSEMPSLPRNNSVTVKSGGFSWRRLRSKGSAVNLASTYGAKANGSSTAISGIAERDVVSPGGSMPSLPMVAHPSSRVAKRDVASVKFDGPNANYMASLARLFDAAQTVDQIARQVDDPGLRHADKTQVGLELCTRHAAEFFGFYICRFVLSDLGMLLDKYVKRGSEWVLS
ncbi:hypothetical protein F5Y17DRAFT_469895 [Xylariaceae sp. FL0594]|nr:hypothetical protein F5Y17DRAFT_469895 [Xylariaceae sp. FL0594]